MPVVKDQAVAHRATEDMAGAMQSTARGRGPPEMVDSLEGGTSVKGMQIVVR